MFSTNPDGSLARRRFVRGPGILVAALAILAGACAPGAIGRAVSLDRTVHRLPRPRRRPRAQKSVRRRARPRCPAVGPIRSS